MANPPITRPRFYSESSDQSSPTQYVFLLNLQLSSCYFLILTYLFRSPDQYSPILRGYQSPILLLRRENARLNQLRESLYRNYDQIREMSRMNREIASDIAMEYQNLVSRKVNVLVGDNLFS